MEGRSQKALVEWEGAVAEETFPVLSSSGSATLRARPWELTVLAVLHRHCASASLQRPFHIGAAFLILYEETRQGGGTMLGA